MIITATEALRALLQFGGGEVIQRNDVLLRPTIFEGPNQRILLRRCYSTPKIPSAERLSFREVGEQSSPSLDREVQLLT